jgi:menaquinone-dependent protoporphyrinogen oxidase
MPSSILVAYATRYGSTREAADAVAAVLRENGLNADLQPASKVTSLSGYDAVALGAPLYIGAFLKDARRFLARFKAELAQKPTAVFVLGPLHNTEKELSDVRAQLNKELALAPWLKPAAVEVFVGTLDPAKLHFPDNLLTRFPASPLYNIQFTDERDWDKLRSWAKALPARLFPTSA